MAVSPDPQTTPQTPPAPTAPKPLPPLFGLRHWTIYCIGVVLILGLLFTATRIFRGAIDTYQFGRPRYAAERAVKALAQGKKEEAQKEVQALMQDVPIQSEGGLLGLPVDETWEGNVKRNRVSILKHLTGQLLAAGLTPEAEDVAWKMMLEFHISSRPLEFIDLWEWMTWVKAIRQDWGAAFESCRILGAHGLPRLREPGQIEPNPVKVDPALTRGLTDTLAQPLMTALTDYYQCTVPAEYHEVAMRLQRLRDQIKQPLVRQKLDDLIHRCLIKADQPAQAHAFFAQTWGGDLELMDRFWREWPEQQSVNLLDRDPTLMGMMWRDRPASATLSLGGFLDSFKSGDPRVRVVDFSRLIRTNIGYFNLANKLTPFGEQMVMGQSIAASMTVQVTRTVHRVYIAYQSVGALGVYPILLVRVDGGPWTPLYCDSDQPDLVYFDTKLEGPANHKFDFVYLNDGAFSVPAKNIKEDRNLALFRMALVQVPPSQKPAAKQPAVKQPLATLPAAEAPVTPEVKQTTQTQAQPQPAQQPTTQSQPTIKSAQPPTTQTQGAVKPAQQLTTQTQAKKLTFNDDESIL